MPNYHYACDACGFEFEIVQSIKANSLTRCEECGEDALGRVIHAPTLCIKAEPKTLGVLAERNTAKMGKSYELQEKRHEQELLRNKNKHKLPKQPRPWWRKSDKIDASLAAYGPEMVVKDKKVVKRGTLSPEGLKYVMEGKKS